MYVKGRENGSTIGELSNWRLTPRQFGKKWHDRKRPLLAYFEDLVFL